jgi:hypothetical protein
MKLKLRQILTKILESIFKFDFESLCFYLGLLLKIIKFEMFLIIKVGNKYVWNWFVNMIFKCIFSLKILMK